MIWRGVKCGFMILFFLHFVFLVFLCSMDWEFDFEIKEKIEIWLVNIAFSFVFEQRMMWAYSKFVCWNSKILTWGCSKLCMVAVLFKSIKIVRSLISSCRVKWEQYCVWGKMNKGFAFLFSFRNSFLVFYHLISMF